MRRTLLLILILCAAYLPAFTQGEIPVDLYTGTPAISIPLGEVSSIDVSQPISISYNANGAMQKSWYGSGWSLQAAASVTREVRGLPDDFGYGTSKSGWLLTFGSGIVAGEVGGFVPASDTVASGTTRSTAESTDYTKLNGWSDAIDTEPDIFSYSVGGLSGKFVFDNTGAVRTIPYRDIKIVVIHTSGSDKKIKAFKITTPDGTKYTFDIVCTAKKQLVEDQWDDTPIFTTEYLQYSNEVSYNAEWMLREIKSPNNNTITYAYTSGEFVSPIPDETINATLFHENDAFVAGSYDYMSRKLFKLKTSRAVKIPLTITASTGPKVEFTYNAQDKVLTKITFVDSRKGASAPANFVRSVDLTYIGVDFVTMGSDGGSELQFRNFLLRRLQETSNCDRMDPYVFEYNASQSSEAENDYTNWTVAVDYLSRAEWLYNKTNSSDANFPLLHIYPEENMAERYRHNYIPGYSLTKYQQQGVYKSGQTKGTLRSITYPEGGRTLMYFEQNRYYDPKTDASAYASGVRVKRVMYFDGTGTPPIVKNFEYVDATGKSSGKIFRKPIYHIPAYQWKDPYYANLSGSSYYRSYESLSPQEKWLYLTIRSDWDIAPNDADNSVGYARVKVSRTGSGYAIHEFNVPATYGQKINGRWKTPVSLFARQPKPSLPTSATSLMDSTMFPRGGTWRYPNAPNPFYDYARGLPVRVSTYSETGKLVKKVETTYQNLAKTDTSAHEVYGIKYDRFALSELNTANNKIFLFSRYFLLTDADKVPKLETVTLYDANEVGSTKYVTETTEYIYGSANHRMVTEVKRTASDGNLYRTKFKYPKDYTNQSSGEAAVLALKNLVDTAYFRHAVPIETLSTLKKGSDSEVVMGGSVLKFDAMGMGRPMLESTWALELDAPVATGSFTNSSVANVSGYKFVIDSRYKKVSGIENYTATGIPIRAMSPITRDSSETAYAFNNSLPVVRAVNAGSNQVAFSDFENTTSFSFNYSNVYLSAGRSGANAFYPLVTLYRNDLKRVAGNNYVIGFWLKSNTTIDFEVKIKNTTPPHSTTYVTESFSVGSTGSEFKYVQRIIPFTNVPANGTFRIEFKSTSSLSTPGTTGYHSGLLPVVDDVFFFPEGVHMESYAYQIPYGVASVTTGTGNASHITYDGLGRETFVRDRNLNILKKTSYQTINSSDPLFAIFSPESAIHVNVSSTFNATAPLCAGTVTYRWDWGNGAGYVTGTATQAHTFTTTGTKTVTLEVSAAGYTTKTFTATIQVLPEAITGNLCVRGVSEFNATTAVYTNGYACTNVTAPATGYTRFKLVDVTGCEGGCTYRWVRREQGSMMWLPVATSGTEYTCDKIVTNTNSFEIACEIRRGSEPPVVIGPMPVNIYHP